MYEKKTGQGKEERLGGHKIYFYLTYVGKRDCVCLQ